ncbi:MAG: TonB-dependent receptor [Gemmatimonadetes bacterium]|nr:TonB-dependent receptor [Gemmatimonadota bacterium]
MTYSRLLQSVSAPAFGALLAVSFASLAIPEARAQAQADEGYVEEVLVTARKREESVLEIPESLSVIAGGDINRQNIKALKDIGFKVPNLNLAMRLDGFPNVSIRGLGAFGNTQGVGFYLDDVQLFSDASSRFGDLARIEVLKGPQGVLYGGSNIGGAVKFVSARPDPEEAFGRVKVLGGQQGMIDAEASVNAPLGDTGWAMRLFGFGSSHDGFIKNRNAVRLNGLRDNNKKNSGETEAYGARVMIGGPLAERFSMLVTARWNEYDGPNNTWNRELGMGPFRYPTTVNTGPTNPRHERRTYAGMVELTWELDNFDIVSVSSFTDTHSTRYSDVDGSPEYLVDLNRPEKMNVLTQEIRLTSTNDSPFQWIAGAYYSLYDENMDSELILWGTFFADYANVVVPHEQELETLNIPFEYRRRDKSHLAGFANVTYEFEEWEVAVGIRVDRWKNKSLNYAIPLAGGLEETEVLPRGSVSRWLNDDHMIYATVAFGYEPGGLNIGDFGLLPFSAEKAASYEVGWKGRFADGRASASIAGFYIDYNKRQVEYHIETPVGPVEGIGNFGDSRQIGFEADLSVQVSEALTLSFAAGAIDAEWTGETLAYGIDFEGEKPPNVPEFSWNVNADYRQPINAGMDFIFGVQVSKNGASDTVQAFHPLRNPSYTVVNAQIGVAGENWEFTVNAENLTAKDYYTDVQSFPNFYGLDADGVCVYPDGTDCLIIGTLGQPRLVTASLSYFF